MLTDNDLAKIGGLIDQKLTLNLKPIHKKLDKITRQMREDFHYLDTWNIRIAKTLEKIANHVGIPITEDIYSGELLPKSSKTRN